MELVAVEKDSPSEDRRPGIGRTGRRRSRRHRRIEPYAWLAAGAVSVGIAASLTGAGVAYADDSTGAASSATSASASTESPSDGAADDGDIRDGNQFGEESTDPDETSDEVSDGDISETGDPGADEDLDQSTDTEAGTDDEPAHLPGEDAQGSKSSATQRNSSSDEEDPITSKTSEIEAESVTTAPPPQLGDVAPSGSEPAVAAVSPAEPDQAASDVADADAAAAAVAAPASMSVPVSEADALSTAMPVAPEAPSTLADLLTAFFVRLQGSLFNLTPTAKPVQRPGQSGQSVVTGTVGATDPDDDPLEVELSVGPQRGSVEVSADGGYIYTPSAALASEGGTDTFTVIVRELNATSHLHGAKGLWSALIRILTGGAVAPDDGSTISRVITATIPKVVGEDADDLISEQSAPSAVLATSQPPSKADAGLSDPFRMPDAISGKTLNVLSYGATNNKSSDNDAVAIQKAINAAQAGDAVYIPNGTYHIKTTIRLKTGVSLVGQSQEGTILASAFSTWSYLFSNPHAVIYAAPGVNNLTVSSFRITVASGKVYNAGVRLGYESGGLVSRIAVNNLSIEKFQRFGIQLQNAYQVLVDGNTIRNAVALDGGGSGYGIIIDQANSSNNWIRNNNVGPVIRHAILVQRAHNNLIEYNRITGAVSGAIDLHGEDEYSNEIAYNTISDCVRNGTMASPNGAGIEIGEYSGIIGTTRMHDNSGPGNWIHHNEVYNCTCGLAITNNSNYTFIEDNIFRDNLSNGILAVAAPLNNLYISRNSVYNNGSGITLNNVTQAFVQDNVIRNNRNYGIWTNAGVTGFTITGNTVLNNGSDMVLGSRTGTYIA